MPQKISFPGPLSTLAFPSPLLTGQLTCQPRECFCDVPHHMQDHLHPFPEGPSLLKLRAPRCPQLVLLGPLQVRPKCLSPFLPGPASAPVSCGQVIGPTPPKNKSLHLEMQSDLLFKAWRSLLSTNYARMNLGYRCSYRSHDSVVYPGLKYWYSTCKWAHSCHQKSFTFVSLKGPPWRSSPSKGSFSRSDHSTTDNHFQMALLWLQKNSSTWALVI